MVHMELFLPMGSTGYEIYWPVVLGGLLLLTAIYKLLVYPALISPLSKVPNAHWSAPFSATWILWIRFTNYENREVQHAHLEKGPVVRLGPNEISVNCVDGGIRTVYGGGFEKRDWYSIFDNYGVPCMFSSWHSRPHSIRKRMISNIYSKSTLQSSAALACQARIILFSRLLPIIAASSDPLQLPHGLDVHDLWNAATMDFITAYIFGLPHSTNFLQNVGYRQHWLDLYQSRKKYTFFPQELPRLTKVAHAVGIRLVPKWVDYANQEIEAFCASMCKNATASIMNQKGPPANPANVAVVLNALLAGHEKERQLKGSDSILSDTVLREPELSVYSEMLDQLAAGHETAGITMTFLTWYLSQDIELQKSLRAELLTLDHPLIHPQSFAPPSTENSAKDGERDSLDDIQMPSSKQLDSLPILHAVIMETLRIKAAIPGGQPRTTPYPSCTLGNYEIPGDVRVGAAAYSLHRNVSVYPKPSVWDHTRWLDTPDQTDESRRERDRWFWAFSSGGRMCVGSNFAMHEMKLITATVYTNFTTHIVNDDGIEQMDGYTCGPTSNRLFLRFEKVQARDSHYLSICMV